MFIFLSLVWLFLCDAFLLVVTLGSLLFVIHYNARTLKTGLEEAPLTHAPADNCDETVRIVSSSELVLVMRLFNFMLFSNVDILPSTYVKQECRAKAVMRAKKSTWSAVRPIVERGWA
jgi:hypothetical protein